MIEVEWSIIALIELDKVLANASSPKGADTIKTAIRRAERTIKLSPRGARYVPERNWYEAVVTRAPFLLIYRFVEHPVGTRVRTIGVFNTRRSPQRKPRRRS